MSYYVSSPSEFRVVKPFTISAFKPFSDHLYRFIFVRGAMCHVHSGVQLILRVVFVFVCFVYRILPVFVFVCFVYRILPVSLDYQFLIAASVFSCVYLHLYHYKIL